MKTIPYGRQWIDESDIKSVTDVLKSDWLTQGLKVRSLRKRFQDIAEQNMLSP